MAWRLFLFLCLIGGFVCFYFIERISQLKMSKVNVEGRPKGGFNFDLCKRNEMLTQKGLKGPSFLKTGTTIVGLVFQVRVFFFFFVLFHVVIFQFWLNFFVVNFWILEGNFLVWNWNLLHMNSGSFNLVRLHCIYFCCNFYLLVVGKQSWHWLWIYCFSVDWNWI